MRNIIISSGLLITLLIILFKLGQIQFVKGNIRMEIIIAITSVIFFIVGIYFNRKNEKGETKSATPALGERTSSANRSLEEQAIEEPQLFIDKKFLQKPQSENFGLSKRELEVLQKMGEGLSNQEIAGALFLSESTIKTHVSSILFKLDAKRRTEAINIARGKGLV